MPKRTFRQEFAALRPLLADYLSTVLPGSNFETEFSPRGILRQRHL